MWSEDEIKAKMGKVHCMDCMDFMVNIPDNYFDLICCDPPYGIGMDRSEQIISKCGVDKSFSSKKLWEKKDWDRAIPRQEIFEEIFRISKNQIIFGGNYFAHSLPITNSWIYWDKKINDKSETFSDGELAWTSYTKALKKYVYGWVGFDYVNNPAKEVKLHPTQKPVELFKLILRDYAKEGFKVYDPFVGSGTTPLACEGLPHLKLEWVGTELEPDYVAIANKRLEKVQGSLF